MKIISNVGGRLIEPEHCKKCGTRLTNLSCGAAEYCPSCEMVLDFVLDAAYPKPLEEIEDARS